MLRWRVCMLQRLLEILRQCHGGLRAEIIFEREADLKKHNQVQEGGRVFTLLWFNK